MRPAILLGLLSFTAIVGCFGGDPTQQKHKLIGREVSVAKHLRDGEEFTIPLAELLQHGSLLFNANWTEQEGGGRPLTKGNGKDLADPNAPLIGQRAFNRVSAPDANSCAGCHNSPYGISGGSGDFVTNVFVLGQRFDFVTFDGADTLPTRGMLDENGKPVSLQNVGNMRATTGMFGSGFIEMLARQMTADLQRLRDSIDPGQTKELVTKGVHFGFLTRRSDGIWDSTRVEGLPRASILAPTPLDRPSLILRPWHQASNVVSLREFTNTAYNQHHGIQSTERFGVDTDPDGDGFTNELSRADVTAVTLYQATLQVPGRVIPRDPEVESAVLEGERIFEHIGCTRCHIPQLPLENPGWAFVEPNPYNPPLNLRTGDAPNLTVDLTNSKLPQPRLQPTKGEKSIVWVPAFTDLKLHDVCEDGEKEPLDMNQTPWTPKFHEGNRRFLTARLWGVANSPPYFHHGLFTTMRQAILGHAGEALQERRSFQELPEEEQDALIEFLKTLQVLPPGTKSLVVDETFRPRQWPNPELKLKDQDLQGQASRALQ